VKIDPAVERELQRYPITFDYMRKHDHVFVVFPSGKRVLVGANGSKLKTYTLRNCLANIRRAAKECLRGADQH
jgi:TATA-box binding protein (TBP) (component of TFIID and TFIIIB)